MRTPPAHPPYHGSVPPKDPTISWRASVALAISTAVLSHRAVRRPRGKNAEVLGGTVMLNNAAFYVCKRKCYMVPRGAHNGLEKKKLVLCTASQFQTHLSSDRY